MKSVIPRILPGVLILLLWGMTWPTSAAVDQTVGFTQANKLYEQGKYTDAALAYDALIKSSSISPALLFNLGDARLKAGQTGLAIAAYRQALRLAPRDPDIRSNLQFARNQAQGGASPTSGTMVIRWVNRLTLNEWSALVSITFVAWCLLFALGQWNTSFRPRLRNAKILLGCLGSLLVIAAASVYQAQQLTRTAIVAVPEAVVRLGPFDESQSAFTARDGIEMEIKDQRPGWWQVVDSTGRSGWIAAPQVVLDPPATLRLR